MSNQVDKISENKWAIIALRKENDTLRTMPYMVFFFVPFKHMLPAEVNNIILKLDGDRSVGGKIP